MPHADLRREATAVIAKEASALLYDTAVWYLVRVCGCVFCGEMSDLVRVCGCVFCGGMSDAMGSKNRCTTLSTEFFDWRIQSKKSSSFYWILQSENSVEKALFRLCKKARFGLQSKLAVFA